MYTLGHAALVASVAFLLQVPVGAHAQAVPRAGNTVRFVLEGGGTPVRGVLSSVTADAWTLTLPDGETQSIVPSSVRSTEVLVRRRNTLRGALIGGGVGLVGGLLANVTADDDCDRDATGICDAIVDVAENAILIMAPLAGALVGTLVGAAIVSERWVPALQPVGSEGALGLEWAIRVGW